MFNEETGMYEGYIYQIYNRFNMKSYIGQTTRTIKERFAVHKANAKNHIDSSRFLYEDAYNYGWDIFNVIEVEKLESHDYDLLRDMLNDREIYYISYYNSLYPNGYNISPGGNFNSINTLKETYQFDLDKNLIAIYRSVSDAAQKTGVSSTRISMCCSGLGVTAGGYYWSHSQTIPECNNHYKKETRIIQYSSDGKLICVFRSIAKAARTMPNTGGKLRTISADIAKCAAGKTKMARGYIWKYYDEIIEVYGRVLEQLPNDVVVMANAHNRNKFPSKSVCQYSLTGEYIDMFNSITKASEKTGVGFSRISACVTGRQKTAGGFIWKYYKE